MEVTNLISLFSKVSCILHISGSKQPEKLCTVEVHVYQIVSEAL